MWTICRCRCDIDLSTADAAWFGVRILWEEAVRVRVSRMAKDGPTAVSDPMGGRIATRGVAARFFNIPQSRSLTLEMA
jgi:hypothetical protein